ncbi:hypothetical protein A4A49_08125 [Nicotiana attenuata]|uniref:Uncharacterized protein n=1 Tax=Nicotiana attenuata TaxID=49451 RepID=A0A1J6IXM5_NICAT|nr:hypothetical protein A4A49_08125 [Nicotiana attenuata]
MASRKRGSSSKQELNNERKNENKALKLENEMLRLKNKLLSERKKNLLCSTCREREKQEKIIEQVLKVMGQLKTEYENLPSSGPKNSQ